MNGPTSPALEGARVGQRPTPAWQFRHRARLYGVLDSRLHSKTRFFGAACVTNRVFGQLASIGGAIAPAHRCADWLSDLGASLETVNRSIAEAVQTGRLAGPALDQRIVSIEQSVVERSLRRARASPTASYCDVLPALDDLLNHRGWISTLPFSPAVRWYRHVLARVRDELSTPIEFARQLHREKIGLALISALQRETRTSARVT